LAPPSSDFMPQFAFTPDLLAPGDQKSAALHPAQFSWARVRDRADPLFQLAYLALWREFGAAHEMESADVLEGRFAFGRDMRYEMVVAGSDGEIAAVRDHTAIWMDGEVVVHLSHVLVIEQWRRSGLAGWMRAAPVLLARDLAEEHGDPRAGITLVGEMEYDDGSDPKRSVRLLAYERAGYLKVDPSRVKYYQPDFRSPEEIDASGGARPLPFQLIVRQVGRESERTITGARVRRIVRALYAMYGGQFRAPDMAHPNLQLGGYPDDGAEIPLIPPTQK